MEQRKAPHLCYRCSRGTDSRRLSYRDLLRRRLSRQAGLLQDCIHTPQPSMSPNKVQLHNQFCRSIATLTDCIYLKSCKCSS
ncbi:unnamed protein product [Haemonchus placei]|uniref:Nuclear receptor domain-containing protein n=1 Tax=Haemonchus placei TaxID=6290 RepID=A0A0N4WBX0_HAEPC|nr:unnamed protein product [Haemonchus placei]